MGPLIPQGVIGSGWFLLIAFLAGVGFGFALEQAGFSSSRKLVGVFYGYDTVVLKVFFTATVVAMLGLLYFSLFHWIDLSLVFVHPTYLWSTIVGGIIMGAGLALGGFCPGTSVAAAAIGKLDGLLFALGVFIGVFIFGEGYSWWKELYLAKNLGPIKLSRLIGISDGLTAFLVVIAAVAMFWAGEWAERVFARPEED